MHLCAPAPFGGLERVIQMLTEGQRRAGHEVRVVAVLSADASAAEDHPFVREIGATGAFVHPISVSGRAYGAERRQIEQLCRRHRPDVFHTHGYRSDVLHAPVARRQGLPTVTTVHGFTGGDWKVRLYERLQEHAFRSFSEVIAVSHPIERRLVRAGVPAGRIHVVQNAWSGKALLDPADARRRLGLGTGSQIGWVGRLSREKGPDIALDALAGLSMADVTLSLIGDGPERSWLERRAVELGIGDRVRFHGAVADAGTLLRAFDALLQSSRTEGTPIVLLEAMGAEVPIVATAVGGIPRMLTDREAFLATRPDAEKLAAGLRQTLLHPELSRIRAMAARERLERDFDPSRWVQFYDEIYISARSHHRRKSAA